MYYVYIFQSQKDKKLYIGFTSNLKKRIRKHRAGEVTSTKTRRPLRLIFYKSFLAEQDALRRERYFKTQKGKVSLKQIIRNSLKQ
ncbi:GIY-YIG nuclease family protein [bacterium]|nr:GIY-YIG nuclease family protein [bacterium]